MELLDLESSLNNGYLFSLTTKRLKVEWTAGRMSTLYAFASWW